MGCHAGEPDEPRRRLRYFVGFAVTQDIRKAILNVPAEARIPLTTGTARSGKARGSRTSPACGGLAAVDVSDFAGDLGNHSDSLAGVLDGQ
jgi:hypothetical protein